MNIGIIGNGAIANYARTRMMAKGHQVAAILVRPNRVDQAELQLGDDLRVVSAISGFPDDIDVVVECAGHQALQQFGVETLLSGRDLVTVSIGAFADEAFSRSLKRAAVTGGSKLHMASGAIGALDALRAAATGRLEDVSYVGRKPPNGWLGSAAEDVLDFLRPLSGPLTHFEGSARDAAIKYPKNANVAAAVAIAGIGFDDTSVTLIADPTITTNIHEIHANGDFGSLSCQIEGLSLPDNPRSSALAAMSVVATVDQLTQQIRF